MLALPHARKPAPPLAARSMWLRPGVGADAFGSALGDAVVGSITKGDAGKAQAENDRGQVYRDGDADRSGLRYGKPDNTRFDLPSIDPNMPFGPSDDPVVNQNLAELDARLHPQEPLADDILLADARTFRRKYDGAIKNGTYDRGSEISSAFRERRWGDLSDNILYDGSDDAKAIAINRAFPQPTAKMREFEMLTGPSLGSIGYSALRYGFDASQETAEFLGTMINGVEGAAGAATPFGRSRGLSPVQVEEASTKITRYSGGQPSAADDFYSPESVSNRTISNRSQYGYAEDGPFPGSFKRPEVDDGRLKNIVNQMYKGDRTADPIGVGSTADAARFEVQTGDLLKGRDHLNNKSPQLVNALDNWVKKNPTASASDLHAAQEMRRDLQNSMKGQNNGKR